MSRGTAPIVRGINCISSGRYNTYLERYLLYPFKEVLAVSVQKGIYCLSSERFLLLQFKEILTVPVQRGTYCFSSERFLLFQFREDLTVSDQRGTYYMSLEMFLLFQFRGVLTVLVQRGSYCFRSERILLFQVREVLTVWVQRGTYCFSSERYILYVFRDVLCCMTGGTVPVYISPVLYLYHHRVTTTLSWEENYFVYNIPWKEKIPSRKIKKKVYCWNPLRYKTIYQAVPWRQQSVYCLLALLNDVARCSKDIKIAVASCYIEVLKAKFVSGSKYFYLIRIKNILNKKNPIWIPILSGQSHPET